MKVKELIEILKKTKMIAPCMTYIGNDVVNRCHKVFSINDMGTNSFGGFHLGTFEFIQENKIIKLFSCINELLEDNEFLEKEIHSIDEITLSQYFNKSSTGNLYYDNGSKLTIILKPKGEIQT